MILYRPAPDLEEKVREIIKLAGLYYIDGNRVKCVRSYGAKGRIYARIHSASKAFFTGLGIKPTYVIEFVAENFDKLPENEKEEIIIHELLHIPKSFKGGLIPHSKINFNKEVKILRKIIRGKKVNQKQNTR